MFDCLISFGSNLGESRQIINQALTRLEGRIADIQPLPPDFVVSEFYLTRPIGGPPDQPGFTNGAARLQTSLPPRTLMDLFQETEQEFGRSRRIRWDSRTLDLDLILYDNRIIDEPGIQVPHPRMSFRRFVLQPAIEIAWDMFHPVCQTTLAQLWMRLQEPGDGILLVVEPGKDHRFATEPSLQELGEAVKRVTFADYDQRKTGNPALLVFDLPPGMSRQEFIRARAGWLKEHAGPLLLLSDAEPAEVGTELSAAIETMRAL